MKATLFWWPKIGKMQQADFEDFYSDDFDVKLDELTNNDDVVIIEIKKIMEVGKP